MELMKLEDVAAQLDARPEDVLRLIATGALAATHLGEGPRRPSNYRVTRQALVEFAAGPAVDLKRVASLFDDQEMARSALAFKNAIFQAAAADTPDSAALEQERVEKLSGREEVRDRRDGRVLRPHVNPMNEQELRESGFFDRTMTITPEMRAIMSRKPPGVEFAGNWAELAFVEAVRKHVQGDFTTIANSTQYSFLGRGAMEFYLSPSDYLANAASALVKVRGKNAVVQHRFVGAQQKTVWFVLRWGELIDAATGGSSRLPSILETIDLAALDAEQRAKIEGMLSDQDRRLVKLAF